MPEKIRSHRDLLVYQRAFDAAIRPHELSKTFPREEAYSLTDPLPRSSRSVCTNLTEAWRKRRYEKAFVSKLSDAEAEAAETQTWIEFAVHFGYLDCTIACKLYHMYETVLHTLVGMINHPDTWIINPKSAQLAEESESYGDPF